MLYSKPVGRIRLFYADLGPNASEQPLELGERIKFSESAPCLPPKQGSRWRALNPQRANDELLKFNRDFTRSSQSSQAKGGFVSQSISAAATASYGDESVDWQQRLDEELESLKLDQARPPTVSYKGQPSAVPSPPMPTYHGQMLSNGPVEWPFRMPEISAVAPLVAPQPLRPPLMNRMPLRAQAPPFQYVPDLFVPIEPNGFAMDGDSGLAIGDDSTNENGGQKDAATQTETKMAEEEILMEMLEDREVIVHFCRNYPETVRELLYSQ